MLNSNFVHFTLYPFSLSFLFSNKKHSKPRKRRIVPTAGERKTFTFIGHCLRRRNNERDFRHFHTFFRLFQPIVCLTFRLAGARFLCLFVKSSYLFFVESSSNLNGLPSWKAQLETARWNLFSVWFFFVQFKKQTLNIHDHGDLC